MYLILIIPLLDASVNSGVVFVLNIPNWYRMNIDVVLMIVQRRAQSPLTSLRAKAGRLGTAAL
jgi:hypothetical protein